MMWRMHTYKPQWHTVRLHLEHLIQDPRFWAVVALVILFGLMILMITLSSSGMIAVPRPMYPVYPYMPNTP